MMRLTGDDVKASEGQKPAMRQCRLALVRRRFPTTAGHFADHQVIGEVAGKIHGIIVCHAQTPAIIPELKTGASNA
jgi:hypothetical protein